MIELTDVVATGLRFPEGPCWSDDGRLFFVDMSMRSIAVVEDGAVKVIVAGDGGPNGAVVGPDGALYVADNGARWPATASTDGEPGPGGHAGRILRVTATGADVYLSEIAGIALDSPNDICADQHGGFYFTDPYWGDDDLLPHQGAVCYIAADGSAVRCATGFAFPNGVCVDPAGTHVLITETQTGKVLIADVLEPGRLGDFRDYAACGVGTSPDGMCFDSTGRLLVAGSTAGCIFVVAEGGGTVERVVRSADHVVTNLCFGGADRRRLYVTEASLGRITTMEWDVPGHPVFTEVSL